MLVSAISGSYVGAKAAAPTDGNGLVNGLATGSRPDVVSDGVSINQSTLEATAVKANTGDPVSDAIQNTLAPVKATMWNAVRTVGKWWSEATIFGLFEAAAVTKQIHTGRFLPNTLKEKLAMEEVRANPLGVTPPRMPAMSDSKNGMMAADGWVKRTQNVNGVEIHYAENVKTGQKVDFKFKD